MTDWTDDIGLIRNPNTQQIAKTQMNANLFVEHCPQIKGAFASDEFIGDIFVRKPLPWNPEANRPFETRDFHELVHFMQSQYFPIEGDRVKNAVLREAEKNRINSLSDYVSSLRWDYKQRVDRWLTYYMGAEDNVYTRAVGKRFLIACVARALKPGCQMDNVLVLEGRQGIKKSTALEVLFSRERYTDDISEIDSRDSKMVWLGKWCCELGEMAAVSKHNENDIKRFFTRKVDEYRKPYAHRNEKHYRQVIFVGTTNERDYLSDSTGNRRYWPVEVSSIDIDALAADREQLFAEACQMYLAGEQHYLTADEQLLADEETAQRRSVDPWYEKMSDAFDDWRGGKTTQYILTLIIGKPPKDQKNGDAKRLAKIMSEIGAKQKYSRAHGRTQRVWYWPD